MAWFPAAWIPQFFAALDAVAPGRDHATDGTVGDLAHASGVSGHNPDDTPGVRAERQDADTKPEVRALDADADLHQSGLSMQMVVDAILRTPRDRDRLIYLIYNRRIWRASNGWRAEVYSGSDPHTTHLHASGHPDADEDGAPWTSILTLRRGGMASLDDKHRGPDGYDRSYATMIADLHDLLFFARYGGAEGFPKTVQQRLADLRAAVEAGGPVTPTDEQWAQLTAAIVAKVGSAVEVALGDQALAELLRRVVVTGRLGVDPVV